MKNIIYIVLAIIIIGAAFTVIGNQNVAEPINSVACTQEAKLCPDDSAVGRVGPMCEFSACPTVSTTTSSISTTTTLNELIRVTSPQSGATISSPVTITGEARGTWYFEASFPIVIVDWDGRIIGTGHAQATGEWMTTNFVPFTATVTFDKPVNTGPQSVRGAIILKNDNPSGMASTSKAIEIPVVFK